LADPVVECGLLKEEHITVIGGVVRKLRIRATITAEKRATEHVREHPAASLTSDL
jgi:hypothetical protein